MLVADTAPREGIVCESEAEKRTREVESRSESLISPSVRRVRVIPPTNHFWVVSIHHFPIATVYIDDGAKGKKKKTERDLVNLAYPIVNLATRPPPARPSLDHTSRGHRRCGSWWKGKGQGWVDHPSCGKKTTTWSCCLGLEAPPLQVTFDGAGRKLSRNITTANDTRMIAVAARRQQEHKTDTPQGSLNKVPLDRHHCTQIRFGHFAMMMPLSGWNATAGNAMTRLGGLDDCSDLELELYTGRPSRT